MYPSASQGLRPTALPLYQHQHLPLVHGPLRPGQRRICHILWNQPTCTRMRRCRSSLANKSQNRLCSVRRTQSGRPPSAACTRTELLGTREHRPILSSYRGLSPSFALYARALNAARKVNERIFVSGQIGLIPSNLTLPSPPSLETETALSFQHVDRVVSALKNNSGGGWEGHEQGIIYWLARESDIPHVKIASEIYEKVGRLLLSDKLPHRMSWLSFQDASASILFVTVPALPKGALVEKQVLLHTGRCLVPDEDDVVIRSVSPSFQRGTSVPPPESPRQDFMSPTTPQAIRWVASRLGPIGRFPTSTRLRLRSRSYASVEMRSMSPRY